MSVSFCEIKVPVVRRKSFVCGTVAITALRWLLRNTRLCLKFQFISQELDQKYLRDIGEQRVIHFFCFFGAYFEVLGGKYEGV